VVATEDDAETSHNYVTEDKTVRGVGSRAAGHGDPPHAHHRCRRAAAVLTSKSKVIGVCIKTERHPARRRTATAAYWYDGGSGSFISSVYRNLPGWVVKFSQRGLAIIARPGPPRPIAECASSPDDVV
jgi:hypothetical protein